MTCNPSSRASAFPCAATLSATRPRAMPSFAMVCLAAGLAACDGSKPASAGDAGATAGAGTGGAGAGGDAGDGGMGGTVGEGGAGHGGSAGAGGNAAGAGGAGVGGGGGAGCQPFVMPSDCTTPDGAVLPGELRCTGLYGDWEARELACGVERYAPAYELWSDAAEKHRYVYLPEDSHIDVSDPNNFVYPVGTQFWKEFRLESADGERLGETRLLRKTDLGWIYTAYVWSADGQSATQVNDGVEDLHGTGHTVPTRDDCKDCHQGRSDFVLGWDPVMLGSGASGVTLEMLAQRGLLVDGDAPAELPQAEIPGDEIERAALGYLHANCGVSCHNPTLEAGAEPSGLFLHLEAGKLDSVSETAAFAGINRPPSPQAKVEGVPDPPGGPYYDFLPLDPERSLSLVRMEIRGTQAQMPRIGTNVVDEEGLAIVRAWIEHMTPERGYPAPEP